MKGLIELTMQIKLEKQRNKLMNWWVVDWWNEWIIEWMSEWSIDGKNKWMKWTDEQKRGDGEMIEEVQSLLFVLFKRLCLVGHSWVSCYFCSIWQCKDS